MSLTEFKTRFVQQITMLNLTLPEPVSSIHYITRDDVMTFLGQVQQ